MDKPAFLAHMMGTSRYFTVKFDIEEFPAADVVSTYQYEEIKAKYETLKKLIDGEWVDCHSVQDALEIDFSTGLDRFDFSREVEWNPAPLNGQKITTKFRLKQNIGVRRSGGDDE